MDQYNPDKTPEVSVMFYFQPEEPQTWDDPGCPAEVEINSLEINEKPISDELAEHLIEKFGEDWKMEILQKAVEYKRRKRRI